MFGITNKAISYVGAEGEPQKVRVIGRKYTNDESPWKVDGGHVVQPGESYVRYEMGRVGAIAIDIVLPSGAEMDWSMVQPKIDDAKCTFPEEFIPSEMLAESGLKIPR